MGRWYNGRWAERGCDGWLRRESGGEVQWAMVGALVGWVGTVCDRWSAGVMGGARECWVGITSE